MSRNDNEYKRLRQCSDFTHIGFQQGKSFFISSESELLKYENRDYYEDTEYTRQVRRYLRNEPAVNMFATEAFLSKLAWLIRIEAPSQTQIDILEEFHISFDSMKQANDFYGMLADLSNHSRKWANCGFTPKEMRLEYMKKASATQKK